jgi:Ca2+-binding RTX toxin-like protein
MSVEFTQTTLVGDLGIINPTVVQWGPDNKLYVASQSGEIAILTVVRDSSGAYVIQSREIINLVHDMPNHNDDGSYNASVVGRQLTGMVVGGTAAAPVIYVSSSDPRTGGGSAGTDQGLDTNSGIISRLTLSGSDWQKVDIVRGLPRAENNHSTNGLAFGPDGSTLLVAQGGMTNAGAPSNSLAGQNEYALSGAILEIDLTKIAQLEAAGLKTYQVGTAPPQLFVYDLPTLNDPTRQDLPGGRDAPGSGSLGGDPFGGDDGLNMAKLVAGGPVQIYAPGFRNPYDVLVAQDGKIFSYDNGPASTQGGVPLDQNGARYTGAPGQIATNLPNENGFGVVDDTDQLQDISVRGVYAGHPNLIRAFGEAAGLLSSPAAGTTNAVLRPSDQLPVDFATAVPQSLRDPRQALYLQGGVADGAVDSGTGSINGLAEYTSSALISDGAGGTDSIRGAIIATSYAGQLIIIDRYADGDGDVEFHTNANGQAVADNKQVIALGGHPLGIDAVGDQGVFPGTIWVTNLATDTVVVLTPTPATGGVTITGTSAADVISPTKTLAGQPLPTSASDTIYGLAGNDQIDGGAGADRMVGGLGNDIYIVDNAGDLTVEVAGEGTDLVKAKVSYTLQAAVENLTLTGTSAIDGTGNGSNNKLTGNNAANRLDGGLGNDVLLGGGGADTLIGGDGLDQLTGAAGRDTLSGGAGADKFIFKATSHTTVALPDVISDFSHSEGDKIDLAAIDAKTGLSGDQAFSFIGTNTFPGGGSAGAGKLRYEHTGSETHILGDVNGDGVADFMIVLTGQLDLQSGDFIL